MQSIKKHRLPLALAAGIFGALLLAIGASALAPPPSLPGSNFEIDTNANLTVQNTGASATGRPSPSRQRSVRTTWPRAGTTTPTPAAPRRTTPVRARRPAASRTTRAISRRSGRTWSRERSTGRCGFLNLFWTRVQEPSGTTLMDFELNKSSTPCANGVNPVRTAGDLLIEYRIEQGGAVASIKVPTWTGSAWGPAMDLTAANLAAGTINSTSITAGNADGSVPSAHGPSVRRSSTSTSSSMRTRASRSGARS